MRSPKVPVVLWSWWSNSTKITRRCVVLQQKIFIPFCCSVWKVSTYFCFPFLLYSESLSFSILPILIKNLIKKIYFWMIFKVIDTFYFLELHCFYWSKHFNVIMELPTGKKRKKQPPSKCWKSQMIRKHINKPCYLFHGKIILFTQSTTYQST